MDCSLLALRSACQGGTECGLGCERHLGQESALALLRQLSTFWRHFQCATLNLAGEAAACRSTKAPLWRQVIPTSSASPHSLSHPHL